MAIIKGNPAVERARGRLSKLLYYRFRNGNTELCSMPQKSDIPRSPDQLAQQDRMTEANRYYARIKNDAEKMAWYKKMAKRKGITDAYHAVISHHMTSPRLRQQDTSAYKGEAGDTVRCQPKVWNRVVSVLVRIKNRLGEEVESGPAAKGEYEWWSYTVRESAAGWEGFTVVFEVTDDLDHVGVKEVPISP
jgi:hypothetical protein